MLFASPASIPFALSAPLRLGRFRRLHAPAAALERVSNGIWRVPKSDSERADDESCVSLTVLHFTGSGESVHAAYENTRALFEAEPLCAGAVHYLFDAPIEKGAYYGPEPFAAALWQRVAPIVRHYEGPFLLVGISRGALVALEHGLRVVEEQGKVGSVLSLSAPLRAPRRIPLAISTIAGFVPVLEVLEQSLAGHLRHMRRLVEPWVRYCYTLLTAMVLRYHRVYRIVGLERNTLDVQDLGALTASLRASREFRLLVRAGERKLQLFGQLVLAALARHPERFSAAFVWGAEDRWIDTGACQTWFAELAQKQQPDLHLATALLPELGHLVRAQEPRTREALSPWLAHAAAEAQRLARLSVERKDALRALQNELHMAGEVRREHE